MNIDNKIISLLLFVVGAFAFIASLILISTPSTTLTALRASPLPSFEVLQDEGTSWAIVGLAISAALAISLPGIGGALGMATASTAALGAITERPELFGKSILYVVFIEAIAIYGFVIAFLLLGYIPELLP